MLKYNNNILFWQLGKGSVDIVYTSRSGHDSADCGRKSDPCASISMAVSHARVKGSLIYIDGTGTSTNPYTCINVTSQHPGIYVDRSMSLIGYQSPGVIECGHGQELTFQAKGGNEMIVKLIGLVFRNSTLQVVDSSIAVDSCQFLGDKQPISVTQDTQPVDITISNSSCVNTTSFISVEMNANNVSGNTVRVKIADSSVQGLNDNLNVAKTSKGKGTALIVTQTNISPHVITIDIHLRNVSVVGNQLSNNGLIHVEVSSGISCNVDLNNVTVTRTNNLGTRNGVVVILGFSQSNILIANTLSKENHNTRFLYMITANGVVRVVNSSFAGHSSVGNGAVLYIYAVNDAKLKVENTTFERNVAEGSGGCFSVTGHTSIVNIWGSMFSDCSGIKASGVGDFTTTSSSSSLVVTVNASRVNGSSSKGPGGVFGCHGPNVIMSIKNTTITDSKAGKVGFGGVVAIGQGSQGMSGNVDIKFDNVNVEGTFSRGGSVISASFLGEGFLTISNSTLKTIGTNGPGGAIYSFGGKVTVNLLSTVFQGCYAALGGGVLYVMGLKRCHCHNIHVMDSSSESEGGAFYVQGPDMEISIHNSYFNNNSAVELNGGVWSFDQSKGAVAINITDSFFVSNTAHARGGAICVWQNKVRLHVSNSVFTNCTSRGLPGGAVYLDLLGSSNVEFTSSKFVNNSSPHAPGGGIYVQTTGDILVDPGCVPKGSHTVKYRKWNHTSTIQISDTDFYGNLALSGGAAYFTQGQIYLDRCRFVDNFASARSGHIEVDSDSTGMVISDSNFTQNQHTKYYEGISFSTATFISTDSAAPLVFDNTIMDSRAKRALDTTLRISKGGEVDFIDSMIKCPIGSSLTVFNFTNKITQNCTIWITSLQFDCHACANGLYSLLRGSSNGTAPASGLQCLPCPFGASCAGEIKANNGFYGYRVRDSPPALNFTVCPVGYCRSPPPDETGYNSCLGNRTGTLCGMCNRGYTATVLSPECIPRGECTDTWMWGVAVVFILLVALYLVSKPPVFAFLVSHILWGRSEPLDDPCVTRDESGVTFEHDGVGKDPGLTHDAGFLKILFYFYQVANLLLVSTTFRSLTRRGPWINNPRSHRLLRHICGYRYTLDGSQTPAWKPSVEKVLYGPFINPVDVSDGVKYWESVLIGRRLVLIAIYASISDVLTRQLALTFVSVLILFHHLFVRPFHDFKANVAEAVSLLCLVVLALASVLRACFTSLGQEPRGAFKSLIVACDWLEVSLLGVVPGLFVLVALISVLSQVARLIWVIVSLLCRKVINSKKRQPLLEVTSHTGESADADGS
ncbi:predicted protein [Nematostella vectensis]|uniref:Right handed beta helix domain-containing protein n=1 Tax=Nematostella vectensis TaxID=45351 RepID=A7RKS2_NEMVE|nr:predicted protein [Nematostella vectensis]|eukprot:XP_001640017.1 predicted protein [Nematostella vectensis]